MIEEMEKLITTDQQCETDPATAVQDQVPVNQSPLFAVAAQQDILNILADYFMPEDRDALHQLISSRIRPLQKLVFHGGGNQLADAFKQLIEASVSVSKSNSFIYPTLSKRNHL
jgi:monoamine oxidase